MRLFTELGAVLALPISDMHADRVPIREDDEWPMECGAAPQPTPCALTVDGQSV